jgi:soluble lytic murein transglycosylase-like protein
MKVLIALLLALVSAAAFGQRLPPNSFQYRAILTHEARTIWGMNANVALYAAQIHQESTWNPDAVSRVGARGLGQFMPGTAQDMQRWYAPQLRGHAIYSPIWSIRALLLYDLRIYNSVTPRVSEIPECDRLAMMLAGYNGGPGWVSRDRTQTRAIGGNPDLWFGSVELYSTRASWAFKENRDYVSRILGPRLDLYLRNGYPGVDPCS